MYIKDKINMRRSVLEREGTIIIADRHVISHNPDLIIVCIGLNDVNNPMDDYI